MADKIKYESIEEIMNDYYPTAEQVEWHGLEIEVKRTVPFALAAEIVRRVTDTCFSADGEYMPEKNDFAFRLCVIDAYTNLELPEEIEAQNRLLYGTDLWGVVERAISEDQIGMIEYGITRRVKVILDTNRAEFEHGVSKVVESLTELNQQMAGMMESVTPEDIRRMISAIGENGIDEEKIVRAVVAEQNKAREAKAEEITDGE